MRLLPALEELAARAIQSALDVDSPAAVRATTTPEHGDYQVNGVLPLAKRLKQNPRALGEQVADRLRAEPTFESVDVAGPGFVNLRLSPSWLAERVLEDARDRDRDGVPRVARPERIVVDFSGPNIAKQMHVGHLRSTIIGDAVVRLLKYVGHDATGDNHLGDWGTQFGLLIVGMREFGSEAELERDPVNELERVYRLAADRAKNDTAFADAARAELAKLQSGDEKNLVLWRHFVSTTRHALDAIYDRLGVRFDEWLGESAYHDMLPGVVDDLVRRGIAREDQGALCVFFEDDPELSKVEAPFIVRKKDGAFLYSTTDIATVLDRRDRFHADRAIYVVDQRQSLHFKQVFAVARKLGVTMRLEHLGFGTVLGPDGKPIKTREGKAVTLISLLDEAEERATTRIREEGLDVPEEEIARVARAVGVGAVRYADLRQNRLSDYQFDWDKMISFKGNAGPYLQYACARVRAIFRKGGIDASKLEHSAPPALDAPEELRLAKQLAVFGDAVHEAAGGTPHLIADHLYALAREFSAFYEACPVLKSEGHTQASRLLLTDLTGRQLARALGLLGIETVERM
jgi:arginyl-tRNA synthetase